MRLSEIRKNYQLKTLSEEELSTNPFELFEVWLDEAIKSEVHEPTAMTLATVNIDGTPSARVVLLKYFTTEGFVFFTNYESQKGQQLIRNAHAAMVFFWPELERQIRIEGSVTKTSEALSNEYFRSRPFKSRLSSVISPQSAIVPNRNYLEKLWEEQHAGSSEESLQRPPNWGGFCLSPTRIEFWQGRANRLHDRLLFHHPRGNWKISRLAP